MKHFNSILSLKILFILVLFFLISPDLQAQEQKDTTDTQERALPLPIDPDPGPTPCNVQSPVPSAISEKSRTCSTVTVERINPPSGVTYYWQMSATQKTTSYGSAKTLQVTSTKMVYLRAYKNGCWSPYYASKHVNVSTPNPATPPVPTVVNNCGKSIVYKTSVSGAQVYWQTSSTGTSTANAASTYERTSSGYVYLRAKKCNSWSTARSVYVTVKAQPAAPQANNITQIGPGFGKFTVAGSDSYSYFWYTSASGGSALNASSSKSYETLVTSNKTYYAQARNTNGCVSSRVPVTITLIDIPKIYTSNGSNEINPTIGYLTLRIPTIYDTYQWYKNGKKITGAKGTTYNATKIGQYSVSVTKSGKTLVSDDFFVSTTLSTQERDFSIKTTLLVEGVTDEDDVANLGFTQKSQEIFYPDAMGGIAQKLTIKGAVDGGDIVEFADPVKQTKSPKQYLSYIVGNSNGQYRENPVSEVKNFYNTGFTPEQTNLIPYSQAEIEESPRKRLTKNAGIGEKNSIASGNVSTYNYELNTAADAIMQLQYQNGQLYKRGVFAANKLYKSISTDADGRTSTSYKDELGRLISSSDGMNITYYVYNEYDQLLILVTPLLTQKINYQANNTAVHLQYIKDLAFTYAYDQQNRLISQSKPGASKEYFVYDKLDRPVLYQNHSMLGKKTWLFNKFNKEGEIVYSGYYPSSRTQADLQADVDQFYEASAAKPYETKGTAIYGYTNTSFPTGISIEDVYSVLYYDDYGFDFASQANLQFTTPQKINGVKSSSNTNGTLTGGRLRKLKSDEWSRFVNYYNFEQQLIQSVQEDYLGHTHRSSFAYNFLGALCEFELTINADTDINLYRKSEFDRLGRLMKVYQSFNEGPLLTIAAYEYNRLGQLKQQAIHQSESGKFLQAMDYGYDGNGRLLSINQQSGTFNAFADAFDIRYFYDQADNNLSNVPSYTGNITGVSWDAPSGLQEEAFGYKYQYDPQNRLTKADSYKKQQGSWSSSTANALNAINYDANGNILALKRTAADGSLMDDLNYRYDANRLISVTERGNKALGFKQSIGELYATQYEYDESSRLIEDRHQGTEISYNFMNKPETIQLKSGYEQVFEYDFAGNLLAEKMLDTENNEVVSRLDYSGIGLWEEGTLKSLQLREGSIVLHGEEQEIPEYRYFMKDAQGNNRVEFSNMQSQVNMTATMESSNEAVASQYYAKLNTAVPVPAPLNHTANTGQHAGAVRLNGGKGVQLGPQLQREVKKGDIVELEVFVKYLDFRQQENGLDALTFMGALMGSNGLSTVSREGITYISNASGEILAPLWSGDDGTAPPLASMDYYLFDANGERIDAGFVKVTEAARVHDERSYYGPHQRLELSIEIPEDGMLVAELIHQADEDVEIYFDDFSFNQLQEGFEVLQRMDYYPFGMPMAHSYKNDTRSQNRYWYNAGSRYNDNTGQYQMHYRHYDATLGRFNVVDPYANEFANLSPYNYGGNNPIMFNDPSGGRMYPNPDHLRSWRELAGGGGGGLGGGPMHSIGPGSNYHWSDGFGGGSYGGGGGGGNWTLSTGNLTVNYGDLADGIHHFGFTNGLASLSKYGWGPNLNTPLMTANEAGHYQTLAGLGLNGSVGNGRNLYSISQGGGKQLFFEGNQNGGLNKNANGRMILDDDIFDYAKTAGSVIRAGASVAKIVESEYVRQATINNTIRGVKSPVANQLKTIAKISKAGAITGIVASWGIAGVEYYNDTDNTSTWVNAGVNTVILGAGIVGTIFAAPAVITGAGIAGAVYGVGYLIYGDEIDGYIDENFGYR